MEDLNDSQIIADEPRELEAYASVTFDDDYTLIVEFASLIEILPEHVENGGAYVVDHVWMTKRDFDALPEFQG